MPAVVCRDVLKGDPSPTLAKRTADKVDKYSMLLIVAQKQAKDELRRKTPTFSPFIVSDYGDLSPGAVDLQEWIVDQYRKKCVAESPRSDGCSPKELVQSFRHRLKIGVQLAIAAGMGEMIHSAGQPWDK